MLWHGNVFNRPKLRANASAIARHRERLDVTTINYLAVKLENEPVSAPPLIFL